MMTLNPLRRLYLSLENLHGWLGRPRHIQSQPRHSGRIARLIETYRNQCHLLFTWYNLLMLEHRHHYDQESQKHLYSSCTDISVNGEVFFELDVVGYVGMP